ncbi:MAG: hypothetical protein VW455_08385 [Nitrospinota bacterium]
MKKSKKNQEEPVEEPEEESSPQKTKKRSLVSKLFRTLFYTFFFVTSAIVAMGVVLEYYFPAEQIRDFAEKEGSKQLQLPLSIKRIKLSLFSGVRVEGVVLGPTTKPLASVQNLVLDYDLSQLLQGHLVINEVLVDHPQLNAVSKNGVWNFQPLLELKGSKKSPPPPSDTSAPLPLAKIDLQQFKIRNAGAMLAMDDQVSAIMRGFNLEAKGKASLNDIDLKLRVLFKTNSKPNIFFKQKKDNIYFESQTNTNILISAKDLKKVNVSGNFGLKGNKIQFGDALPSPSLEGSLTAEIQMKPERVNLSLFSLILDGKNVVSLSTKVKNFSTAPEIETQIKKISFHLSDLLRWAKKWLPPVTGHGKLEMDNLTIQANLPGFKPENIKVTGGQLSTKDLTLDSKDLNIHLESLNTSLNIQEVSVKKAKPTLVSADLQMQLAKGKTGEAEIQNLKQTAAVTAKGPELSKAKLKFNTNVGALHYQHPDLGTFQLPFHTEGSLEGDLKKGDLNIHKISYHSGNTVKGNISGNLRQKKSFQLKKESSINIGEVLKILPGEIAEMFPKLEGSGNVEASVSLNGNLDSKFLPTQIQGNSKLNLKNVSTRLENPNLNIEGLNTAVQFPIFYSAKQGINIATININSDLKNVDALKNWNLKNFSLNSRLDTQSFYNLKPNFGTLPIKLNSKIKFENLASAQPELSLENFTTEVRVKGDIRPDDFRNNQIEGKISFQNVNALKKLSIGDFTSQYSIQVHDKSLSRIRLSQKTKISSINEKELGLNLKELNIESLTRKNLQDGNFDLENLHFKATNLVDLHLKGSAKSWGESFGIETSLTNAQLASLWKLVPTGTKKNLDLEGLGGKANLSLKAQGKLPASKTKDIKPLNRWTKLFTSFEPNNPPPLEISSQFKLQNGKLTHTDKDIKELNLDSKVEFKKGSAWLSGNISGKLHGMEVFEKRPLQPEFNFQYHLKNFNTFKIAKHQLNLKNRGITHTFQGKIEGIKALLKGPIEPDRVLQKLNIDLKNSNNLKAEKSLEDELFGDLKAAGELSSQIILKQTAGEKIYLEGQLGFNQLNAEIPSAVTLKNLTGKFPFSKTLSLSPDMVSTIAESPAQKRFFKQLRDFSRYKNNIRADSIELKGQEISNMGMDVVFKNNRLSADKFIFDVLGGTVGGSFSFTQTPKGPALRFVTEFAKIDSSRLLPSKEKMKIDSKIDGNMDVAFQVETEDVSLDNLLLKIAITKIGTQTLDRLLLYLDPEESKPAIADTRAKLKIATPHRVLISLENGNLNLEAWLKSDLLGIIKAPELKRIPVAGLNQFSSINEQLQSLQGTLKALNIIAAQKIQNENGKLVFKN